MISELEGEWEDKKMTRDEHEERVQVHMELKSGSAERAFNVRIAWVVNCAAAGCNGPVARMRNNKSHRELHSAMKTGRLNGDMKNMWNFGFRFR